MPITNLNYRSSKYLYGFVFSSPLLIVQTPKSCGTLHLPIVSPHNVNLVGLWSGRMKCDPPFFKSIFTLIYDLNCLELQYSSSLNWTSLRSTNHWEPLLFHWFHQSQRRRPGNLYTKFLCLKCPLSDQIELVASIRSFLTQSIWKINPNPKQIYFRNYRTTYSYLNSPSRFSLRSITTLLPLNPPAFSYRSSVCWSFCDMPNTSCPSKICYWFPRDTTLIINPSNTMFHYIYLLRLFLHGWSGGFPK